MQFTTQQKRHNSTMIKLLTYAIAVLIVLNMSSTQVHADENESNKNKSQIIIANKYAEKFCSAKSDNYFQGLDNEKTLKYSYFKYIGIKSEGIDSKETYKIFINLIREKCATNDKEEREIYEFFFKNPSL